MGIEIAEKSKETGVQMCDGNPISLPIFDDSILSSYQSNNVVVYHCVLDLL